MTQMSFFPEEHFKDSWSKEEGDARLNEIRKNIRLNHIRRMREALNRTDKQFNDRRTDLGETE